MPNPGWIRLIVGLVGAALFGLSALTGDSINEQGLRWLSLLSGVIVLLLLAFDRLLWRAPLVRLLSELSGTPVLHGTWLGTLAYTDDGAGNPGRTEFFMAIFQTYSQIEIFCYFPRTGAESWSLAAALCRKRNRFDLRYIYQQMAPVPHRDGNRPTEGTCQLAAAGRPVRQLEGSYYSERGGSGTISLRRCSNRAAGSLVEAERLRSV